MSGVCCACSHMRFLSREGTEVNLRAFVFIYIPEVSVMWPIGASGLYNTKGTSLSGVVKNVDGVFHDYVKIDHLPK